MTSTILSDVKSLKMMNYVDTVLGTVHTARLDELNHQQVSEF